MIDAVLLCIAWAVFGYALAMIEHERSASTSNPRSPTSVDHAPLSPVANAISLKHRPDRFPCYHKRRPMPDIPQDIFAAILRGEKNEKSRKRNQAMVRRVRINASLLQ